MRCVVQRVSRAGVTVAGEAIGQISGGLLVLVGFTENDGEEQVDWMTRKILGLRIFGDEDGKMNLDVRECGGEVLVVSQFTLYGDARRGNRPSFIKAARPEVAIPLYESFVERLRKGDLRVSTGDFGAMMDVALVNHGPVTIILEK